MSAGYTPAQRIQLMLIRLNGEVNSPVRRSRSSESAVAEVRHSVCELISWRATETWGLYVERTQYTVNGCIIDWFYAEPQWWTAEDHRQHRPHYSPASITINQRQLRWTDAPTPVCHTRNVLLHLTQRARCTTALQHHCPGWRRERVRFKIWRRRLLSSQLEGDCDLTSFNNLLIYVVFLNVTILKDKFVSTQLETVK